VAFSADGTRNDSGSMDQTVKVWDAQTGKELLTLKGHTDWVTSVAFSADGTRIVSGSMDQTVKVWDAQTGKELLTLKGHTNGVSSVAFSPDGKRLVSQDYGRKEITWDLTTAKPIPGASKQFLHPLRSPDGRFLVLVEDTVIRVHRLISDDREKQAAGDWWADPDHRWHAAQAQEAWQTGDWFAAAFHLDRQLRACPWDAGLHLRQAHALSRLGRTGQSATHYLQAVLVEPHISPWPLDPDAGRRVQQAGDGPGAIADLELAAHQPGATATTWCDLLLARRVTAPKGARPSCREILDRFESNAAASQQLVFSCREGPCDEADARRVVKVAERLVTGRRDAVTLDLLGSALYRAGRFAEAERTLQESIKAQGKGGDADVWLFLAMTQQRLDRGVQARESLTRFEGWLTRQKFATWQEGTRWRLLYEEARGLILFMPRVAK
jgi:hypothetical protein